MTSSNEQFSSIATATGLHDSLNIMDFKTSWRQHIQDIRARDTKYLESGRQIISTFLRSAQAPPFSALNHLFLQ